MFERYGIYYTFDEAIGETGAKWLGWDIARARAHAAEDYTKRPCKYGFHATVKAPFHLADGKTEADLQHAFNTLCATVSPVTPGALQLKSIGRFLALTIKGDDTALKSLASTVVRNMDVLRAPLTNDAIARRMKSRLSDAQIANLHRWGYPYVMDNYQFHVTLTGPVKEPQSEEVHAKATRVFTPLLHTSFALAHLTLVGERADGHFVQITRLPLTG